MSGDWEGWKLPLREGEVSGVSEGFDDEVEDE